MLYLSGCVYAPILHYEYGGIMLTPEVGNKVDLSDVTWGADNGCYTAADRFSSDKWLSFLEKYKGQGNCLFAVAPDIPFNMDATWERSRPFLPIIRDMGYPACLAIQNGVTELEWDSFDAVFIAGDKEFKTSADAYRIAREAKAKGKLVHVARRNSYRALIEAYDLGADSVDGTFLKFGPDKNWTRLQYWFHRLYEVPHQGKLWSMQDVEV